MMPRLCSSLARQLLLLLMMMMMTKLMLQKLLKTFYCGINPASILASNCTKLPQL